MSFVSGTFLLFLPLTVLLYWVCPARYRYILLLMASCLFYMGWSAPLFLLLLSVTALCYAGCLLVEKHRSKGLLAVLLVLAFAPLFVCKYLFFTAASLSGLIGWPGQETLTRLSGIILPVGISFYTFQAVSCVLDVYRGEQRPERNFLRFALFVSFFPQLVAGPIEQARDLMPQLRAERRWNPEDLAAGGRLLLCGFLRKICLADFLAPVVDRIFALEHPDGMSVLLSGILFGLQIYNDFAGYSEIAMGSARLLGIRLTRNFQEPYLSRGIRDFWRRWHITLNRWFRLYVYQPLGGKNRRLVSVTAVFLLSGLWHGADWTFIAWGAFHALLYGAETLLEKQWKKRIPAPVSIPLTFLVVSVSWILFRAGTSLQAVQMLGKLVSVWHPAAAWQEIGMSLGQAVHLLVLLPVSFLAGRWAFREEKSLSVRSMAICVLLVLLIAVSWLMNLRDGTPNAFIYFQF